MTFDEKLTHIENALAKVRQMRSESADHDGTNVSFSNEEYNVLEASLEVTLGVCTILQEWKERHQL